MLKEEEEDQGDWMNSYTPTPSKKKSKQLKGSPRRDDSVHLDTSQQFTP